MVRSILPINGNCKQGRRKKEVRSFLSTLANILCILVKEFKGFLVPRVNGTIPIGHRSRNISREYHYRSLDSIREVTPLNGWECIGRASLALTMGPFGDNGGRPRDFMEPEARQGEKGNAGPKFLFIKSAKLSSLPHLPMSISKEAISLYCEMERGRETI